MYVYDHTSSRVVRKGAFAKMKVVTFINVRTFEVTPKDLMFYSGAYTA